VVVALFPRVNDGLKVTVPGPENFDHELKSTPLIGKLSSMIVPFSVALFVGRVIV
jgi:hypothetical protein